MRDRKVLLPGVTRLARVVAKVRDDTNQRLWDELESALTVEQRGVLDRLLEVRPGERVSDLERWRKGPVPRGSGLAVVKALDQVSEVSALGLAGLGVEGRVPARRLGELAKYGMNANVAQLRRHPSGRRFATMVATVRQVEALSVDNALELLDLLMSAELLGKARSAADKRKIRTHPRLAKASARLAVAVTALFASDEWAETGAGPPRVGEVWAAIEQVVSRGELRAALAVVGEEAPAVGETDPDDWRAELVGRYASVAGFVKMLPDVIVFDANAEGTRVLQAMRALPEVMAYRGRAPAPLIPGKLIDPAVVSGPWRRLVFGAPVHEGGDGGSARVCVLCVGAILAASETTGDLRGSVHEVAQPGGSAVGRRPVAGDPG